MIETFFFNKGIFFVLDQRLLPGKKVYLKAKSYSDVANIIKNMVVRGAPAIGVSAAYGYALGVGKGVSEKKVYNSLLKTRPTAVNLFWALNKIRKFYFEGHKTFSDLINFANYLKKQDIETNKKIGQNGLLLFKTKLNKKISGQYKKINILTHCNAGALATSGYGTAVGVIRALKKENILGTVYIDETRPYLQGARLTAFELLEDKIDCVLITDNMAGLVMKKGLVDAVIVGADRIAANGDTANKIGTYSLSILAKYHDIPFFIAAPVSTIDFTIKSGKDIKIEERKKEEMIILNEKIIAPKNIKVYNPAFDVTPNKNITAIITEEGNKFPDYSKTLKSINKPK